MRAAYAIIVAFTAGLAGCKQEEVSCSSLETQSYLKTAISTPRGSQAVELYTPEVDISLTNLRRAERLSDNGNILCSGEVALAENMTQGLPRRDFAISYEIWGKPNSLSLRVLTPDEY